ncbi:MAG TPA: S8 family serine peptidase [Vicinamibacteria bacterium]|nr:S8 family serine peptidase [Vicinamibacteria bacterium]
MAAKRRKIVRPSRASHMKKLDALLHTTRSVGLLAREELVSVIVDCTARRKVSPKIDAWGGGCSGIAGTENTIVARVPREKLAALARMKDVRYVEASTRLKLHCDRAHVSSGLVRGNSRTVSQTGAGVLVGVVDTGIDVKHPAFRINGKTRIVNYLDQFTDRELDASAIDAGAADDVTDPVGHGTHVAGIAAGNGAGSPGRRLRGVAPEADLAIVKTTLESADILRGIAHIFDLAGKRGQPCVVNCSFGGHFGGHDGTTIVERTIDELSGPGKLVVVSAGNEGGDPIHAHTRLRGDGASPARWEAAFHLKPRVVDTETGSQELGVLGLQVWQQREDALRIALHAPGGQVVEAPEEGLSELDFDSFFVSVSRQVHPYSGDPFVTFQLFAAAQTAWLTGWRLVVEEVSPGSAKVGAVHAWMGDGAEGNFVTGATFEYLVGMPATAYSAIAVGSYVTRNEWSSRDPAHPTVRLEALQLESLSEFSSRGPTRDGQNKPEVTAPGEWLLAPLSSAASPTELPLFTRVSDIDYAALRGTSMSAPYVTGALALLLQKDGTIDWAEAKRRIMKSTRQDENTAVCWNRDWGYGKLDVARLLAVEP